MPQQKIYLVGAGIQGWEGFSTRALEVIGTADVLIGHQRHLDIFPDFPGEKQVLGDLSIMLEFLKSTDRVVVVLGSGDPNFFGVGRFLLRNLPKDRIEIFPNVTSIQYAFAQIKEPWDDAIFVSVHGRGLKGAVDRIIAAEKAAVLTDNVNTPAAIARELIHRGAEGYEAYLCEEMGLPGEKFTKTDVRGLVDLPSAPLNILILIKTWEPNLTHYPLIGIADDEFATAKKLITKQEVRAVTLSKLQLQDDCYWTWSEGLFLERQYASGHFALEQIHPYVIGHRKNSSPQRMLIEAFAPEGLEDLPDPDRVFIGGSGGMLEEIIDAVDKRLKREGVIVLNAVTLDTLTKAVEFLEDHGYAVEVTCVNIAKTRGLTEYKMFDAHNPVYIIAAWKGEE